MRTISTYVRECLGGRGIKCKNSLIVYFNRAVAAIGTHQGMHPDELAIGFTVSNGHVKSVSPVLGNWSKGNWSFFPTSGAVYSPEDWDE